MDRARGGSTLLGKAACNRRKHGVDFHEAVRTGSERWRQGSRVAHGRSGRDPAW